MSAILGMVGGAAVLGVGEVLRKMAEHRSMGSSAVYVTIPATITSAVGAGMLGASVMALAGLPTYTAITALAVGVIAATRCVYTARTI